MKRNTYTAIMALALAAAPFAVRADTSHQDMVMEHGAQVMPFDQKQAMHMFLPSATGGVVEIVVHDMDATRLPSFGRTCSKRPQCSHAATIRTLHTFMERQCRV